jgi:hypothetical protein
MPAWLRRHPRACPRFQWLAATLSLPCLAVAEPPLASGHWLLGQRRSALADDHVLLFPPLNQVLDRELANRPGEPYQVLAPSRVASDYKKDLAELKVAALLRVWALAGWAVLALAVDMAVWLVVVWLCCMAGAACTVPMARAPWLFTWDSRVRATTVCPVVLMFPQGQIALINASAILAPLRTFPLLQLGFAVRGVCTVHLVHPLQFDLITTPEGNTM